MIITNGAYRWEIAAGENTIDKLLAIATTLDEASVWARENT